MSFGGKLRLEGGEGKSNFVFDFLHPLSLLQCDSMFFSHATMDLVEGALIPSVNGFTNALLMVQH